MKKYIRFNKDLCDDNGVVIFEKGKEYLITYEDDEVYMCGDKGIEKKAQVGWEIHIERAGDICDA